MLDELEKGKSHQFVNKSAPFLLSKACIFRRDFKCQTTKFYRERCDWARQDKCPKAMTHEAVQTVREMGEYERS